MIILIILLDQTSNNLTKNFIVVVERSETSSLDQKYQAPINEVSSIINDPSSMSQSLINQNVSVGRHGDILQHQSQQNSINGNV